MIICEECGAVFPDSELIRKEERNSGYKLTFCPYCRSEILAIEAHQCERCGEYIPDDERFCPCCKDEIKGSLGTIMKTMKVDEDTLGELIVDYYGW